MRENIKSKPIKNGVKPNHRAYKKNKSFRQFKDEIDRLP